MTLIEFENAVRAHRVAHVRVVLGDRVTVMAHAREDKLVEIGVGRTFIEAARNLLSNLEIINEDDVPR